MKANINSLNKLAFSSFSSSFTKFIRSFIQVGMLTLGGYYVIKGEMSSGAIIANSIMLTRALAPLEVISSGWKTLQESILAFSIINGIKNRKLNKTSKEFLFDDADNSIKCENLSFYVGTPPKPFIKSISFSINSGNVLAIIGPSGSGKSTLMRMLLGVQNPHGGSVKYGNTELSTLSNNFFSNKVGFVPQQLQLFPGSIGVNIARFSEKNLDLIIQASILSGCHDFISQLPDGYDTVLDSLRSNLSLGQQQRIALARAVYGKPSLVFLDEPNSNLDIEGELALVEMIKKLKADGVTVILIAHRTGILGCCDKLLVMNAGQIALFGERDEVLAKLSSKVKS